MKPRILSSCLLASLLLGALASCGGEAETTANDTVPAGNDTPAETEAAEESPYEKDALPELDFGGTAFRVLYRDDLVDSFFRAEQDGDVVDDAVYSANLAVEERLNVDYQLTTLAGSASADRDNYNNAIINSVLSGDDAYDMVTIMTYYTPTIICSGALLDLMSTKYLDFTKPWWVQDLTNLATLNGKLYFASGDISLELMQRTYCMLFNKKVATDLDTENLYDIVKSGKWTIDTAARIAKDTYADLNSNGSIDPEDRYGLVISDYNHAAGFICSTDLELTSRDKDGIQHIDCGSQRAVDIVQRMVGFANDTPGVFYQTQNDAGSTEKHQIYYNMFRENRLLLITAEFDQVRTIYRDMDSEFGVIPYPKFDESQAEYHTLARNTYSSFAIPTTCKDPDMVSAVMEAQASQNYRTTSQTYFETALKVKYSRDDMTSQMFDIIKAGSKFNFGVTFSLVMGGVQTKFNRSMADNNPNWASTYAAIEQSAEETLQKFYSDAAALD
ncbi:MAG: hypothetical protein MJ175_11880 [Clostridia bacterium]|nr:hypothetical protein [Clostridia bacterium]